MTELVILRLLVISSMVWFIASEWFHSKQLDSAFNRGFRRARKIYMEHHSEFLDDIYNDINLLQKEFMKLEQGNEKGIGKAGFSETSGINTEPDDIEPSEPSRERHVSAGGDRED